VIGAELRNQIETRCADVGREVIEDFFSRMGEDYFSTYPPEQICAHLRMSGALNAEHPVRCQITPRGAGEFDVVIVGFDYLSEFSLFCGLLTAFGFDIRAGNSYSFARRAPEPSRRWRGRRPGHVKPPPPSPRKIVDIFHVSLPPGEGWGAARGAEFERELQALVRLLAAGSPEEARERLNHYLIGRLERAGEQLSGLLSPVAVDFDNHLSADWTVMDVRSQDAPAFLYAFSNALAMRGVYIHQVSIQSARGEVRDRFLISNRWGRKIEDEREQETLRMAVTLIKQFTRSLPAAPDPARALRHFDQFLDKVMDEGMASQVMSFFAGREGMDLLAHLLGSSDYLWEDFLRLHVPDLLPALENFARMDLRRGRESLRAELAAQLAGAATFAEQKRALNEFKDRQTFLIDCKHLLDPQATLIDFSHALTDLAEVVLDRAAAICHRHLSEQYGEPRLEDGAACPFAICGLGKFGGREMGYASDLEVLFLYAGPGRTRGGRALDNAEYFDLLVRQVVEFIEARQSGIFHLDLRLRPHGKAGPLASPFAPLPAYYSPQGEAAPFERQALIKLRRVAGDPALGRRLEALRDRFTYSGAPWDRENALRLRRRQARELVKPGQVNVKYSPGGIIDIEYAAQYLQLLHGHEHPELRTTSTLEALDRLCQLCLISGAEHAELRAAYLFLRNLIDALRIVRGDARDLILPAETSEEMIALARRLGSRAADWEESARSLAAEARERMREVRAFYLARFDLESNLKFEI